MAKKVVQLYDKYKSTTKVFPKIIEECFEESAKEYITGQVVANPTPTGEETTLATLKIGSTQYAIPVPTSVIANPELVGTEAELGSLQIGDTKYKIGGGKQLYQHNITMQYSYYIIRFEIINDSATSITSIDTIKDYLFNNNFKFEYNAKNCNGYMDNGSYEGAIYGIHRLTNTGYIQADYFKNGTPTTEDIPDPTAIYDNVITL